MFSYYQYTIMYTYVLGTFILRYRYNKEIIEDIYSRYA